MFLGLAKDGDSFNLLVVLQYDYEIEEKQLYQWLQPRLVSADFQFKVRY